MAGRRLLRNALFLPGILLMLSACRAGEPAQGHDQTELVVAAASSLQDVMRDIRETFEKEHPDVELTFHFGSSGSLKQQIARGAPVDVFISASEDHVKELIQKERMRKADTQKIMKNRLVLITPAEVSSSITRVEDLTTVGLKTAAGVPESVPAGAYAKEALEYYGIWNEIENQLVRAKNVRQVLTYVENGNVDAGFVYKTDALVSGNVQVVKEIKEGAVTPIIYPAGIVTGTKHKKESQELLAFLTSDKIPDIVSEYGFETETIK
ncbi:molybdate ABC transporter substrate-binding protein [Salibacterium qingdaonense]|uniref:Molybdate transport system substrate-binding protein n=1 Tax=Salibacterium qingdaonense TaxID=266892 RepID=A0A1I4K309_9BACI|nr:molybdate ABC transporter substrate-binding protein [Salibacterium qingdaonense]SFL73132.1 molybdate transport system substrate-binding protein [Salibacterium qingdaonense]